jgi:hypothetical protein
MTSTYDFFIYRRRCQYATLLLATVFCILGGILQKQKSEWYALLCFLPPVWSSGTQSDDDYVIEQMTKDMNCLF